MVCVHLFISIIETKDRKMRDENMVGALFYICLADL